MTLLLYSNVDHKSTSKSNYKVFRQYDGIANNEGKEFYDIIMKPEVLFRAKL